MNPKTTIIFHISKEHSQSLIETSRLKAQIKRLKNHHLIAIADHSINQDFHDIELIESKNQSYPELWNNALSRVSTPTFIYIDNRNVSITLAKSSIDLFTIAKSRHSRAGMIYADYKDKEREIHLLHHHKGRLRDNQDYGKVFLFDTEIVHSIGGFDTNLNFNHLYDLRLKLSEISTIHLVSNKFGGSLYTTHTSNEETNVFDYLISNKDQQLEAETILTNHLDRIQAKLHSNQHFDVAPKDSLDLIASVIIPVNNRPGFIGTAIESVQQQTRSDIEVIIIVNGGKNDPTIPIVKNYQPGGKYYHPQKPKVRLLITDINNIGFCINLGVKHAKGTYYVQLDSDDRLKSNAIESIVNVFETDPTIGLVIGSYEVWEKQDSGQLVRMDKLPVVTHDEWTDDNGRNNLLRINGAGAPRSIPIKLIKEIGWFGVNDEPFSLNYGEDYDMVLRISEKYKVGRIYQPIYEVVRHSGGTDHTINQSVIDRNDEAKDWMRLQALNRRIEMNNSDKIIN